MSVESHPLYQGIAQQRLAASSGESTARNRWRRNALTTPTTTILPFQGCAQGVGNGLILRGLADKHGAGGIRASSTDPSHHVRRDGGPKSPPSATRWAE